ncbi:pentatricopeptide repeat-containing protein, mitochondrial [Trifolium repens]|nr:pentatricopeptide repeat-containing protein, mitochondrial [Trifolium repens]
MQTPTTKQITQIPTSKKPTLQCSRVRPLSIITNPIHLSNTLQTFLTLPILNIPNNKCSPSNNISNRNFIKHLNCILHFTTPRIQRHKR